MSIVILFLISCALGTFCVLLLEGEEDSNRIAFFPRVSTRLPYAFFVAACT